MPPVGLLQLKAEPGFFSLFLTHCSMSLLIFLGVAVATALFALNTFDQLKASLKPIPVRAKNRR